MCITVSFDLLSDRLLTLNLFQRTHPIVPFNEISTFKILDILSIIRVSSGITGTEVGDGSGWNILPTLLKKLGVPFPYIQLYKPLENIYIE